MIEFGTPTVTHGIEFENRETGQEFLVAVHDKFPQMGDVHVEGRRFVEVSVEMFIQLMDAVGFTPVLPGDNDEKRV